MVLSWKPNIKFRQPLILKGVVEPWVNAIDSASLGLFRSVDYLVGVTFDVFN